MLRLLLLSLHLCFFLAAQGALVSVNLTVTDPNMGKINRTYLLGVPHKASSSMPLLLGFHGQGGDKTWEQSHSFTAKAAAAGWLVAYPLGLAEDQDTGWNCGTGGDNSTCVEGTTNSHCHASCRKLKTCGRCNWSTCYDDVHFISELLASLTKTYPALDKTRTFAVGQSNGAMFIHHLLHSLPGTFRAAVPVFGTPLMGYLVRFISISACYVLSCIPFCLPWLAG